ncbi:MAG: putative DNA-binding protein [Modestobacter sp.]|nr:putative DNA-binding protein [Modestobacter sp.]
MSSDRDTTRHDFAGSVNMTVDELEEWLATEESRSVGQKTGGSDESTGHESGRRIVQLLRTKAADLTDDDLSHMRKVHGYVQRHLAQEPAEEVVETSKWRYSLMNWGHDPLRGGSGGSTKR